MSSHRSRSFRKNCLLPPYTHKAFIMSKPCIVRIQRHLCTNSAFIRISPRYFLLLSLQFGACICGYTAIDFEEISWVCKSKSEFLCCVNEQCLDYYEPSLGCGMTTNEDNKECCKVSVPCYSIGLKKPERLCAGASRYLCFKSAQSLPYHKDYVDECVCAYYGIQCAPECSCCGPAGTDSPALDRPLTIYEAPIQGVIERAEVVDEKTSLTKSVVY